MTDTLIADAWLKHYDGNMFDHNIGVAYAAERAWNASARATLAQIKPFLELYQKYNQRWLTNTLTEALDISYQAHVVPLLKELEE